MNVADVIHTWISTQLPDDLIVNGEPPTSDGLPAASVITLPTNNNDGPVIHLVLYSKDTVQVDQDVMVHYADPELFDILKLHLDIRIERWRRTTKFKPPSKPILRSVGGTW